MNKFYSFCQKFILIFGLVFLLFIGISNCFVHGHLDYDTEYMYLNRNNILFYILLAIYVFIIWKFKELLGKLPAKKVFIVCSIFYILFGAYMIIRLPGEIRDDPYYIYKYAERFLQGDYEGLTKGFYLCYFPYQIGMVTFEMGLLSIWNSTKILFLVNLLMVLGINLIQWKMTGHLFKDNRIEVFCILMSFGFVPMLFYIMFVYGSIPGYFFVCLSYVFLIRYLEKGTLPSAIICGLCLGISVILKPNYLIAVMATCIVIFIDFIRKPAAKKILIIVMIAVLSLAPNKVFFQMWRNISGINFDGRSPVMLNITMGLTPEEKGVGRVGGWYTGYNFDTIAANEFDMDVISQIAVDDCKEAVKYWFTGEDNPVEFFGKKILTSWCDPLFQCFYVGPQEEVGQVVEDKILRSFFHRGHASMAVEAYMNPLMVIIYLLSAAWCFKNIIKKNNDNTKELFNILLFIGSLLFFMISETKSQYVFMFAYGIIPYAAKMIFDKKESSNDL